MQKTLGILVLCALMLDMAGCSPEPPPFDPRRIEFIQKSPAAGIPLPPMGPGITTLPSYVTVTRTPGGILSYQPHQIPRPSTRPAGPVVRLTIQEAIHRMVANSLDVRVAGYQPAIDELRVLEEMGAFDPSYYSTAQFQRQFPQGVVPSSLSPNEMMSQMIKTGFRQNLTSGAQIDIGYQKQRWNFQKTVGIFNTDLTRETIWQDQIALQITQPLLQNFGAEVNRAQITVAQNDQKISQLEFRNTLEKQVQAVEEAYWRLAAAQRDIQIQEQLLRDTDRSWAIMVQRQTRDTTPLQVMQVRASTEQRNADLIQSQARMLNYSEELKRLIGDPDLPPGSAMVVEPASAPVQEPVRFALVDQIETALQNRLELLQQTLRIDSARTVIKAAKNNELPKLNLVGQLGVEGWGNSPNDATGELWQTQLATWSFGVEFEVPLGNRVARAIYQRTLLQYQATVLEYQRLAKQVASEVAQSQNVLVATWETIGARRLAAFAARDALDQLEQRERHEERAFAPEFVQLKLQFQELLASALRQEAQAIADYNVALSALEKAKGTLLRYENILMKEEKGPMSAKAVR